MRANLLSMSGQALGLLTTRVQGGNTSGPGVLTSTLPSWEARLLPIAWHVGTWKGPWTKSPETWLPIQGLPLTNFVTWG